MKKIFYFILIMMTFYTKSISAQGCEMGPFPPSEVKNGVTYWNGVSVSDVADHSDLIFEGRILFDSVFMLPSVYIVSTYTRVLVLKQFKGNFISDTITVIYNGGHMVYRDVPQGGFPAYAHKGDEAIFFVTYGQKIKFGVHDSNVFHILYGNKSGFIKVCDKKDVVKEVYEPIEAVTGQPYVDVHPNMCATQKQK